MFYAISFYNTKTYDFTLEILFILKFLESMVFTYFNFLGGNQHDAQEFLLWLLDKVHEELNTATAKKYKRLKVSYNLRIILEKLLIQLFRDDNFLILNID